jgi:hypothetical protein
MSTCLSQKISVRASEGQTTSKYQEMLFGLSDTNWRSILIVSTFLLGASSWAWSASTSRRAVSKCQITSIPVVLGPITELTMTAKQGASCPIFVRTTIAAIDRIVVTVKPRNGTATPRATSGIIYRSNSRFTGDDFFVFNTWFNLLNYKKKSEVRVKVTVR